MSSGSRFDAIRRSGLVDHAVMALHDPGLGHNLVDENEALEATKQH